MQTADRVQNADWVQNADCKLGTKCRLRSNICDNMSSYSLPNVTQSLFRDHLSRIFLARFLITVVLNIISSLHILFLRDVNLIKVDIDVNEMPLLNI